MDLQKSAVPAGLFRSPTTTKSRSWCPWRRAFSAYFTRSLGMLMVVVTMVVFMDSWVGLQQSQLVAAACLKRDPKIHKVPPKGIVRLPFGASPPGTRDLDHPGTQPQRLQHGLEQKRVPQFLPCDGLDPLALEDAESVCQVGESRAIEHAKDRLEDSVQEALERIVSAETALAFPPCGRHNIVTVLGLGNQLFHRGRIGLEVARHHQYVAARGPFECVAYGAAEKRALLPAHLNQPGMFTAKLFRDCQRRRRGPLARDDQNLGYLRSE